MGVRDNFRHSSREFRERPADAALDCVHRGESMKDRKLASRYARALLSAVPDPRVREQIDAFLAALAKTLGESARLRTAMLDPAVPRPKRKEILHSLVARQQLPATLDNFFATLVDNNRMVALPSIAAVFHELREQAMGIVPAELTTATPLSEEMKDRARRAMEKMTGKQVRLTCAVEPALVGGAVTRIGSMVYDGSLRHQLGTLKRKMAQE